MTEAESHLLVERRDGILILTDIFGVQTGLVVADSFPTENPFRLNWFLESLQPRAAIHVTANRQTQ